MRKRVIVPFSELVEMYDNDPSSITEMVESELIRAGADLDRGRVCKYYDDGFVVYEWSDGRSTWYEE